MIDVLVAYTKSARAETGNVDALIRLAIDQMNRVYANSRVDARVRLVHRYQTEYVPRGDMLAVASRTFRPLPMVNWTRCMRCATDMERISSFC